MENKKNLGDETSIGINNMLNKSLKGDWIGVLFVIGMPLIVGIIIGRVTKK